MLRTSRAQPDWEHEGESALVAASSKAQIKCVNELIKAGAEVNQRDSNGKKKRQLTPLSTVPYESEMEIKGTCAPGDGVW